MFRTSKTIAEISKALLSIQNEFLVIKKDAQGQRNKYVDYPHLIAESKPILTRCGLVLMQPVTHFGELPTITTILIHAESSEFFESVSIVNAMSEQLNAQGKPIISDEQRVGGGISYMKRYALSSMLSWATGDYDLDRGIIEEKSKKEQFIIESFQSLLDESMQDDEFKNIIMESLELITDLTGKKQLYAQLKNVVIPKAEEDTATALSMFKDTVRDLT